MNKVNKNKILENRFEGDASQGFNLVHGADDFFKTIKSPFKAAPKGISMSHWGFLSLEIIVVITLIVTAKLIDISTDSSEFAFSSSQPEKQIAVPEIVPEEKFIITETAPVTTVSVHKIINQDPILPSSFSNAINTDTTSTLMVLNVNGLIEKVDSVVKTEPRYSFSYADVKAKYELCYLENLLVIDYSDTLFTGEKLDPLLTGVPAPYENKDKIANNKLNPSGSNTFVKRDDYLERLNKPLRSLMNKKYERALKGFKEILEKDAADQNALFYGGLAYFNLADYSNALISFEKLKQIKDPLFEEDADWLMAKVYQGLGLTDNATKLLQAIAHSNSFYRAQAIEELKR